MTKNINYTGIFENQAPDTQKPWALYGKWGLKGLYITDLVGKSFTIFTTLFSQTISPFARILPADWFPGNMEDCIIWNDFPLLIFPHAQVTWSCGIAKKKRDRKGPFISAGNDLYSLPPNVCYLSSSYRMLGCRKGRDLVTTQKLSHCIAFVC